MGTDQVFEIEYLHPIPHAGPAAVDLSLRPGAANLLGTEDLVDVDPLHSLFRRLHLKPEWADLPGG